MDQSRAQFLKSLANAITFIVLLILFLAFYFINETDRFLKGSTTFASRTESTETFSIPVIVICFEPANKVSVNGNQSVSFDYIFEDLFWTNQGEQSLVDYLKAANYKLDRDVKLQFTIREDGKDGTNYNLFEGTNTFENFQMDIHQIYTLALGGCYVMDSPDKLATETSFYVNIKDLNADNEDRLKKLTIYMASHQTWHGLISLSWPYVKLVRHVFNFNTTERYWIDFYVTELTYQRGHERVEDCIEALMAANDNCKKCVPFFFSFLEFRPSCETFEENKCWYSWMFISKRYKEYKRCMKPRKSIQNKGEPSLVEGSKIDNDSLEIIFTYASDEVAIMEETLIMSTSSYIGSVGGSLGLFLGFSFFTFLSYCIEKLFELCSNFQQ